MKKILFSLLLSVVSLATFAQNSESIRLELILNDHSLIAVNLDGKFIDQHTIALRLDGINPGQHRISVFKMVGYRRPPIRVFSGTIFLHPYTDNSAIVDVYRRSMSMHTSMEDENRGEGNGQDDRWGDRQDNPSNGYNNNGYSNDHNNSSQGYQNGGNKNYYQGYPNNSNDYNNNKNSNDRNGVPIANEDHQGYGSYPHGRNNGNQPNMAGNVLSQSDLYTLQNQVKTRNTDSEKEQLMKSYLNNRSYNSDQVRTMLSWLLFDSGRMDFVKWAYTHVTDKQNYWRLENAFSNRNSKDEFNQAFGGR